MVWVHAFASAQALRFIPLMLDKYYYPWPKDWAGRNGELLHPYDACTRLASSSPPLCFVVLLTLLGYTA